VIAYTKEVPCARSDYQQALPIDNEAALVDITLPKPVPTGRDILVQGRRSQ